MFDCNNLLHPFQNDPGTSQRQRVINELLSDSVKIDGRTLADLLNYFSQLSRNINYYDQNLNVSDWQPFFDKSLPFLLASINKYDTTAINNKFLFYQSLFEKNPSVSGLQLCIYYTYYNTIGKINSWYLQVKGTGLAIESFMETLIRQKLIDLLKKFVALSNAASQTYCITHIDFSKFTGSDSIWGLDIRDLYTADQSFRKGILGRCNRMKALYSQFATIFLSFLEAVKLLAQPAGDDIEESLLPLKEELQKQHTPHLALIFAFLKLFQQLQGDLNKKTRDHLNFFYKNVLQIKPRDARPDKAHIIFELQKVLQDQYMQYPMSSDKQVKDGKDNNKADILFKLNEEIIVNETQVAEVRTLYLNNKEIYDQTYLEGVYMAPAADKADGVDKDFTADPKNWYTLGNDVSKYTEPGKSEPKPYPPARIGFILGSKVLYLQEGKRTIDIRLACIIDNSCTGGEYPDFLPSDAALFNQVNTILSKTFYFISEDLMAAAVKKGLSTDLVDKLRSTYLEATETNVCNHSSIIKRSQALIAGNWDPGFSTQEKTTLTGYFKPQRAFKISFSGEKEWIEPDPADIISIEIINLVAATNQFQFHINVILDTDKPAVSFYNKDKLIEDFGTKQPLVKIELNDLVKLNVNIGNQNPACCVERKVGEVNQPLSLYHFFRNVVLDNSVNNNTNITVSVCGLKNFIVQNDENVMDVNATIYPFGTRPKIVDFDAVNPADPPLPNPNLIGPNFYLGSKEIFFKKWQKICVKLNWKDKPSNFNEYYKAYLKREKYHDCSNPPLLNQTIYGLNECDFFVRLSLLENSSWKEEGNNRLLFDKEACSTGCTPANPYDYSFFIQPGDFGTNTAFTDFDENLKRFEVSTKYGFIKFNLRNQDFLHKDFAFVLGRQMMAMGKFPDKGVEGAVYFGKGGAVIVFKDTGTQIVKLEGFINNTATDAGSAKTDVDNLNANITAARTGGSDGGAAITNAEFNDPNLVAGNPSIAASLGSAVTDAANTKTDADKAATALIDLKKNLSIFDFIFGGGKLSDDLSVPIPNEPWTPIIKEIELDYTATATITDIDLIHLYPYTGTYKPEQMQLGPSLFPVFCDEGTLFIGLTKLVPGINVNMLFQLAEATGDSEYEKEQVQWQYLSNNAWKDLREGFEIVDDASNGLTTSGIIKFATPAGMTNANTLLPKDLYWIKASVPKNSKSISETLQVLTQAVLATFTNQPENDKLRLSAPLEAGSISKLAVADASIKKVAQPFESFDGLVPEETEHYYTRVSELLRHKGRAIQKWDYERLALEAFPQLFKTKCVNHSFYTNAHIYKNDFPYAPGYVMLAVIPDLRQLKAGNSFEPKAPVSLLEKIEEAIRLLTSPFVRLKAVNPRYEGVDFCLTVRLLHGKDENYYREKLKEDLRVFLAPWAIGQYDKLSFGQCINRSDIIRFLENTSYVDFIAELRMKHHDSPNPPADIAKVCPVSPRSILIAGDIDVTIDPEACEQWCADKITTTNCNTPLLINDYCK